MKIIPDSDVLIIGAGVCGLMTALILAKKGKQVEIVEARNRTGGRIETVQPLSFNRPIETGAVFIHGNQPHTIRLLNEFGIKYHKTHGQIWQVQHDDFKKEKDFIEDDDHVLEKSLKELNEDISIEQFMDTYLAGDKYTSLKKSLRKFVEGYDAADISRASALGLKEEWLNEDDQYRIEGGYGSLINALTDACEKAGCKIHLSAIITSIEWQIGFVTAISETHQKY